MKKLLCILTIVCVVGLTACGTNGTSASKVIIYSNADEEAVEIMKTVLDANGYEGKYVIQSYGTSELGGKLLAEKDKIEADIVTLSSYYLESAQQQGTIFKALDFKVNTLHDTPDYYAPIIGLEGALFVNTEVMKENNLPQPKSIKDLSESVYNGQISVSDIQASSTAWLLIQSLLDSYSEQETKTILQAIYKNASAHIETSGSAPLKQVRVGEVAIGFGLRHQAVRDEEEGLPIKVIDPQEGTFVLTESIAMLDKKDKTNPLASEMVQCIIEKGRPELLSFYPAPLYENEEQGDTRIRYFSQPLTVDLLKEHQQMSESVK